MPPGTTDERLAEAAAAADRARLAALVADLGAGVLVEDEHRRIALVNDDFCAMFGIPAPPATLVGTDCSGAAEQTMGLFAEPEAFVSGVAEVLAACEPRRGDILPLADGRVFERDFTPLTRGGVSLGNVWVYRDVTAREREAAQLARSDRTATELLAILADPDVPLAERQARLLDACCDLLGLDVGLISRYVGDEAEVLAARDPEGRITAGMRVPISETYAGLRAGNHQPTTFLRASGTPLEDLPAFRNHGQEAYVGVPIIVEGRPSGTLAFSSRTPRTEPFSERAVNLVRLMALWIGSDRSRRRAEADLRASQGRATATIRTALDGIITIGVDERVLEFNPAAEAIFGHAAGDVIGRTMTELIIPPELRAAHKDGIARYLRTGEARALNQRLELPALRADGSRFLCELAATAVEVDGEPIAFTAYVRDISERKRFEEDLARARDEALEAGRMKSDFLAMISHEIRTPMNGVIGASDLLRDTPLEADQRELVEMVHQSSHALLAIVDDVLETAKIEAGKLDLAAEPFDLHEVVEAAAQVGAGDARAKGLILTTSVDADVPASLVGDPGRVRQILVNLVTNAVKFTEAGEITIAARVAGRDGARVRLELEVVDTGVGIPHAAQKHLFQPFSQVDATSTRRHGGTGLGLVISDRLAGLMGGGIALDSAPGRGTRMTVTIEATAHDGAAQPPRPLAGRRVLIAGLPPLATEALTTTLGALGVATADDAAPDVALVGDDAARAAVPEGMPVVTLGGAGADLQPPVRATRLAERLLEALGAPLTETAPQRALPATPVRARILVAEDSDVNRTLMLRQLERLGIAADVVTNGSEAIAAVARHDYPLILMDLRMPELDGFDATRAIRAAETGGRVPIVAVTANAARADRDACLAAGMDDHLSKPVTLESLRHVIARWLPIGDGPAAADDDPDRPSATIRAALDQLAGELGGREAVAPIVRRWDDELPGRIAALEQAAATADRDELRRVAHTLRGATEIFGGAQVAGACTALELAAADDLTASHAAALVEVVERACAEARTAMLAWLDAA